MHKHIKRWGQVFLKSKLIQKKIADLINSSGYSNILEIGPGDGALTQYINTDNKEFVVVELDKKLASYLSEKYKSIRVIQGDFLDLEFSFMDNNKGLLFGNIPYYITSLIIFNFLSNDNFEEAIFMVQKEFYESICSKESFKKYTSFAALLQSYSTIERILNVGRNNFFPIPNVDSVVIRLRKKETKLVDCLDSYSKFLKKSFFMPRKTLANNWKKFLDDQQIQEIFKKNSLKINVRPDEISPDKYEEIFLSHFGKKWFHNIV